MIRCGSRVIKFEKDTLLNFALKSCLQGRNGPEEDYLTTDTSIEH